uniref:Uncharacterized protein n=1 Tax=Oryza punctata TaxID=4537 RepID=A0A0E0MEG5_ORYPU
MLYHAKSTCFRLTLPIQLIILSSLRPPSVISLELAHTLGCTPALESLPTLSIALVRLDDRCRDYCLITLYSGDCGNQVSCGNYCTRFYHVYHDDCVLLDGLSNVTNLELITSHKVEYLHLF